MDGIRSWWEVPSIAHFCSLFRSAFDLDDFDIEDLENGLLASAGLEENYFLADLISQLLQGCYIKTYISHLNYESFLNDILTRRWENEERRANPLVNSSFKSLSLRLKVEILHSICDYRLDALDVPDKLKGIESDNMRVDPLGEDSAGATYWYFYGTRLYKEDIKPDPPPMENKNQKGKDKKKKQQKNKKHTETGKRGRRRRSRGWSKPKKHVQQQSDSESEQEGNSSDKADIEESPKEAVRWHLVCSTLEDWQALADKFVRSKVKCERELHKAIVQDFLPEIPILIEEKEKELRKRLLLTAPRRTSSRLETRRNSKTEDSNSSDFIVGEKEIDAAEREQQKELERQEEEKRQKEEKEKARENRTRRSFLREERARYVAEGKDIPPDLYDDPHDKSKEEAKPEPPDAKTFSGMLKVIKAVRAHKNAWPFCEPVQESYAPSYFEIIKHPMDLSTMEKKVRSKDYMSKMQFISDFKQIGRNCQKYNGPESEYSDMATILGRSFNNAVKKYIPKREAADDHEFMGGTSHQGSEYHNPASRPSRAASSRALEALHQAAADALRASSLSGSSSSDDQSGDETAECSSRLGLVIKMVPFPGSAGSVHSNNSNSSHSTHNPPEHTNSHSMQHYSQNSMPQNINTNSMEANFEIGNHDQGFSFTAMLQDCSPQAIYDNTVKPNEQFPGYNPSGFFQHNSMLKNPQQYSFDPNNSAFASDIKPKGENMQQGKTKGDTIDQGAFSQLSFSAVPNGYEMNPGHMQYPQHNNGEPSAGHIQEDNQLRQAPPWNGQNPHMVQQNQLAQNIGPRQPYPGMSRLEHNHSPTMMRPGSNLGHALPQQPAPRTSRVQIRPKPPVASYSSAGNRPILPKSGTDQGPKQAGDPFSLLKKNIRDLEQKESASRSNIKSEIPAQNGSVSPIARLIENVSPTDSLSSTSSKDTRENQVINFSNTDQKKPNNTIGYAEHQVYQQAQINVVVPSSITSTSQDVFAAKDHLDALNDKVNSLGDSNELLDEDDSDISSTASNEESPMKALNVPGHKGTEEKIANPYTQNMSGNVTHPGFPENQPWKTSNPPQGPPKLNPENQPWKTSNPPQGPPQLNPSPTDALAQVVSGYPNSHLAQRETQLYGPPSNMVVMPGGGFQGMHRDGQGQLPGMPPLRRDMHPIKIEQGMAQKTELKNDPKKEDLARQSPSLTEDKQATQPDKPRFVSETKINAHIADSKPPLTGIPYKNVQHPSAMYDYRTSIMEQAKLMQREGKTESVGNGQHHLPTTVPSPFHPYDPLRHPYHIGQHPLGHESLPGQEPRPTANQQQIKDSKIPNQSQPPKKRKLYENIEHEVPKTPPSKIWRPGVDPSVHSAGIGQVPIALNLPPMHGLAAHQHPHLNMRSATPPNAHDTKGMGQSSFKPVTSSAKDKFVTSESSVTSDRTSPHLSSSKAGLNLSHLKQETSKPSLTSKPSSHLSSSSQSPGASQSALPTNTHPTYVTMPGLGQAHMMAAGHPGMPHPMAMMGLQAQASPYYHQYMMQQRQAETEMQKHLQENGLLYQQQMMQQQMMQQQLHGFPGYQQFSPQMAAAVAAQQKMMVPENTAQQRLLAHLAQTHQANGLLHQQYQGAGRPPHQ